MVKRILYQVQMIMTGVIQTVHLINQDANKRAFDSVRGVFWEGKPLYPNAGFAEKHHIQICVCNPNCTKAISCQGESMWIIPIHNTLPSTFPSISLFFENIL